MTPTAAINTAKNLMREIRSLKIIRAAATITKGSNK